MKILQILGQSKEQLAQAALTRKANAIKRNQETLIDKLEEKRDEIKDKQDKLVSVTVDKVNEKTWAEDYHKTKVDLALIEKEIEIAKDTLKEFFTDEETAK